MSTKDELLTTSEPLDIMEMMEVKGGADPRHICFLKSAVKCSNGPAVVNCSGVPALPTEPKPGDKV